MGASLSKEGALPPLHDPTSWLPEDFLNLCRRLGVKEIHAYRAFRAVQRQGVDGLQTLASLPQDLRRWLERLAQGASPFELIGHVQTSDGTSKLALRFSDGAAVETVLIRAQGRTTQCISTQSGCALRCRFCATGAAGFSRNLDPSEMIAQIHACRRQTSETPRNLVLMGMGEPLLNYDAVARFLALVTDPRGLGYAPKHITLSTAGIVPGIRRMAADRLPCNLAVSLNATTDAVRTALMPINRRWPLRELLASLRDYTRATGKKVLVEYVLLAGLNDADEDATRLSILLRGLPATVNLIPYNPTGGPFRRPSAHRIEHFRRLLTQLGVRAIVRWSRGAERQAACGQLAQALQSV